MKPQCRTHTKKDCAIKLRSVRTPLAVFKPVNGFGGIGIRIAPREKLLATLQRYNGVICEFIDTSAGIPGLLKGRHDLRMTIMNGEIVEVLIRIPRDGSYLANIARGATIREPHPRVLPPSARRIAMMVDRRLEKYGHRIYAVDVGYEKDRPYLFELNNEPGLPYKEWGSVYGRWHRGLLKVLRAAARDAKSAHL